jgi:hypothetical protein
MRRLLLTIFILLWIIAAVTGGQKLTSKINDALQIKSSVAFSAVD